MENPKNVEDTVQKQLVQLVGSKKDSVASNSIS